MDTLNRLWPFIFIGREGPVPLQVETLTNHMSKYNFYTDSTDQNRSDRPMNRSDRSARVQNFPRPYLSHPKSKLDIPHMHFDILDESYTMVKSILPFKHVDQTSLIGL